MNQPDRTGPWQAEASGAPPADAAPEEQPQRIGRYRIERVLGQGGFGVVYLAHDDKLNRLVALKVPHRKLIDRPEDTEAYLREAQNVANLDHPHIVPVHDVGSTEECPFFIVSKFIEGSTLAKKIKEVRPPATESAALVATVAEALHYAHRKGLVHRDIKPGNILLDTNGKPYVADFGLALREENLGQGPKFAGTPAYMSPEQARGEGHRVDGRSDIFSLGVVLYELLTGRQPFRANCKDELLEQITTLEPRPLRQIDEEIPKELERICFRALAKRAAERYLTAKDLADDLRHFLAEQTVHQLSAPVSTSLKPASPSVATSPSSTAATTPPSDSQPIKIVPKGLRSFDAHDADFFLELLPGPRDREGLPDSIRFWKTRIEETDSDNTFSVGLIYGPSGCGKSSLVKAGLLPRLSENVLTVYLEATGGETETRLLNGLRKRCPSLPVHLALKETLAALRRGQGIPVGKKVLIVLDQFEQWLHAKREEQNTELVGALRQCESGRVQCIVMVRDDFWMAATRFMRDLEIRLVEGQNSAAVDLFDGDHAKKVLAAFGRAFGKLPETTPTKEQKEFLSHAVSGLAQEGKIICVRLALFAEMMKGKPWTPATLKAVGGTEGVGVTFLEETFSAATAPPEHRYHQKAARAVLKALLPESGTDLKGHMRSDAELLAASGYGSRPKDFDDLIRILDSEIRLLTPTDPEGSEGAEEARSEVHPGQKYYQLTHDYLVHSLRDWLTRKQKESRRGRAELQLADRASVWNARPENRQLPSLPQWTSIELFTQKKNWTEPQRKMMRKATRYHVVRGVALAVLVLVLTLTLLGVRSQIVEQNQATHAAGLVQRLLDANLVQVPGIITEVEAYRAWADPLLREENAKAAKDSRQKLHTSLALLPVDPTQVDYLYERLLDAGPMELPVIREALVGYRGDLVERLWSVLGQAQQDPERRLRAACVLATYDPGGDAKDTRWQTAAPFVTDQLLAAVQRNPSHYLPLLEMLRPVRERLFGPLTEAYRNRERPESERSFAITILADYASDQAGMLANLLLDADAKPFAVLYPAVAARRERALAVFQETIHTALTSQKAEEERERLAKRQANAAVALLRMDQAAEVWPLLKHSPDPRVRSYLIHRLGPMGADVRTVVKRLDEEPNVTIRRALVLSLGEFGEKEFPPSERALVVEKLREVYRTAADPGLRGAAEWLLRQWKQDRWLKQIDEEWAKDKPQREQRLERIRRRMAKGKDKPTPQWYINGQGQTMVVLPGPMEFLMGSPPTEAGRDDWEGDDRERLHLQRIGRTFAIAAKPVTVEQFQRFRMGHAYLKLFAPSDDCPVNYLTWYLAAEYCNWLSMQEGLPEEEWCYKPNDKGRFEEGMSLVPNYLRRTGYRLPTEAEWEYACRSGSLMGRYYGASEELLGKYGWNQSSSKSRSWPVGSLKPNDFGLFDMHGNVWTWCQERYKEDVVNKNGGITEDNEDNRLIIDGIQKRVWRGGSYWDPAVWVRSAVRFWYMPAMPFGSVGLRPARTFATE